MKIVVLTGMSGAGKSLAAQYLEDMGFFCVDNLPPQILPELVRTFVKGPGGEGLAIQDLAFVIDVRSADMFSGIGPALCAVEEMGVPCRIIYLEAADQTLINRYKETRRNHPLAREIGLREALTLERSRLEPIKDLAGDVVDTTNMAPSDLRDYLYKLLSEEGSENRMSILVQSFGFKYGIPIDSDNVIDVRFIPNPFYRPELRPLSGLDAEVREHVLGQEETREFMDRLDRLLSYAIPYYIREGKVRLNLAVGCTGGRHRSVVLAEDLARRLRAHGLKVAVDHRDLENDPRKGHGTPA